MKENSLISNQNFYKQVVEILQSAKQRVVSMVNHTMVLTKELGKGFLVTNIERMRLFYLTYNNSAIALPISENDQNVPYMFKLCWSHYLKLMRIDDKEERQFNEIEILK